MSYLIDTHVIAELCRKIPNTNLVEWFSQRPASTLFLSVLTLGELRRGIENTTETQLRIRLLDWLETDLPNFFAGRILPFDTSIANKWGHIMATANRPLPAIASLIGATAAYHNLCLVTRHAQDFVDLGVEVINPWG